MDKPTPEAVILAKKITNYWPVDCEHEGVFYPHGIAYLASSIEKMTRKIEGLRAAAQLALDCHYHHETTCECWIPPARAAAQGGKGNGE